jgi:hypothetical protein
MPNVPISGLPLTTSVCATALVPIVQNGVTCSTYACLLGSGGGGGGGVTQITAGSGVTISPSCGVGNVTICASGGGGGVTQICGGSGISISPSCGTGVVTICSTGGGSSPMVAGSGTCSIQGNGCSNSAYGNFSFVGGGQCNIAGCYSFVGGGCCNYGYSCLNTIAGGFCNFNNGVCGNAIIGGFCNFTNACFSSILGGCGNTANGFSSVGGFSNITCSTFGAIVGGCSNIIFSGYSFIGAGIGNSIYNVASSIVGGTYNSISGNYSTVSGGYCNRIVSGSHSVINGGYANTSCAPNSFIGGGRTNTISVFGCGASILGGIGNTASAGYSGVYGCNVCNTTACSFMSNQLVACNLFGAGAICANASGVIVPVVSDARLKTNICSLDCGINRVSLLNPVTYNWIDEKHGKGQQIGFIAQEVEKVVPEAVFKTSNDDYGFNDRPLVALLTKTIQEQELRITKLENLVQELLNK